MITSLFFVAAISPITIASIAIFVAVTAGAWFAISRVSGNDQPTAEARLDALRQGRKTVEVLSESEKSRKKSDAFALCSRKQPRRWRKPLRVTKKR